MIPTKPVTLFFLGQDGAATEIQACSTYQSVPSLWPYHEDSSIVNVTSLFVVFPCTLPSPDDCSSFPQEASSPHYCEAFRGLQLSFLFMDDNSYTVLLCSEFVFILGTHPTPPQYQCELMRQVQD